MIFAMEITAPTLEQCKTAKDNKTEYCLEADRASNTDINRKRYRTGCIIFSLRENECSYFYSGQFDTNFKTSDGKYNCDRLKSYYDHICKYQTFYDKKYRPKTCLSLNDVVQSCIELRSAEKIRDEIKAEIARVVQEKARLEGKN